MRFSTLIAAALIVSLGSVAFAELQNVEVGGSIRIRGNMFNMDDSFADTSFVEQRTRLNVKADFTQEVSAFIEFDYYDVWGEDFRSVYLTGADFRSGANDVDLYQGYIEARNMWGAPLSMRVGRQELAFGSEWLVGNNDSSAFFTGLSFDALRVTFANDMFTIDGVAAKLVETYSDFGDDDVDLYALYFSYIGIEDITLDAYWMFVRDDQGVIAGVIGGDEADLHTIGLRGAGVINAFDFEVEAAYQIGDVEGVRSACPVGFGEADVDFDEFAVNAEVGYTFDMAWTPRLFARFAYFGGGDPDESIWSNDRDLPFNRLFSDVEYSEFLDNADTALSNVLVYTLGVEVMPTEAISLKLVGSYLDADEEREARGWWFWRENVDSDLGWEVGLYGTYNYSEDLVFRAGYAHFFGSDGLDCNNVLANGLAPVLGDDDDDYDYLFIETEICF
jgi:hypothetical protein